MEKPGNASRSKWMLLAVTAFAGAPGLSQPPGTEDIHERFRRMSREAEQRGLAEPFRGVTTDGKVVRGLFGLHSTGVSTEPVRHGAATFVEALTPEQRNMNSALSEAR